MRPLFNLNKEISYCSFLLAVFIFSFVDASYSQMSISGPTCIVAGTQYTYTIAGNWTNSTTMTWTVNGGSISGNSSGTPLPQVHVTFTGAGYVKVVTSNPTSSTTLNVTTAPTLSGGTISNPSQSINYNTLPDTIKCSAATGGACSPTYSYQWQQSTDDSHWTNVGTGGSSQNLIFTSNLTTSTYFRRFVTEMSSGNTAYSAIPNAYVQVYPQFVIGAAQSAQTINFNTAPAQLSITGVSGGNGTYSYLWQSSPDNVHWTAITTATSAMYLPSRLTSSTYFNIIVTSNGIPLTSNSVLISVNPEVFPGVLTPSYININSGSSPGEIDCSPAFGGACSGSYSYQWQSSTDGVNFTNIGGVTSLNYSPGKYIVECVV